MAYDGELIEGWEKYGQLGGFVNISATSAGEWNSWYNNNSASLIAQLIPSLQGPGLGLYLAGNIGYSGSGCVGPIQQLSNNYARVVGSMYFNSNLFNVLGVQYMDGATVQASVGIANTSGRPFVARGDIVTGSGALATGSLAAAANTVHCLQWDLTIHNTAGACKMWLDGILCLNVTGLNTRNSGNNFFNAVVPTAQVYYGGGNGGNFDHLWNGFWVASGGSDTPPLTNAIVETSWASADSSVQFTPGAGVIGSTYTSSSSNNAPGANFLALRRFVPVVNETLNSISISCNAANGTANFRPAVYSDASGAAGTLLSTGAQVTGCPAGILTMPLTTPQSLTAGTAIWLGYITDTSVALNQSDNNAVGYKAASTYTSGAPSTAPAMTSGQPSWIMYGNTTGMAHNWSQTSNSFGNAYAQGDISYNSSATVNNQDLFTFTPLVGTPQTIYTMAVKAFMRLDNAGVHTMNLITQSGATTGTGNSTGFGPSPVSYSWVKSFFDTDPNTSAPWASATALNSATSGYKIVT